VKFSEIYGILRNFKFHAALLKIPYRAP